jgi:hypothetical protein
LNQVELKVFYFNESLLKNKGVDVHTLKPSLVQSNQQQQQQQQQLHQFNLNDSKNLFSNIQFPSFVNNTNQQNQTNAPTTSPLNIQFQTQHHHQQQQQQQQQQHTNFLSTSLPPTSVMDSLMMQKLQQNPSHSILNPNFGNIMPHHQFQRQTTNAFSPPSTSNDTPNLSKLLNSTSITSPLSSMAGGFGNEKTILKNNKVTPAKKIGSTTTRKIKTEKKLPLLLSTSFPSSTKVKAATNQKKVSFFSSRRLVKEFKKKSFIP